MSYSSGRDGPSISPVPSWSSTLVRFPSIVTMTTMLRTHPFGLQSFVGLLTHNISPRTLTTTFTKTRSCRSRSISLWPGAGSCSPSIRSSQARSSPRFCELSPPRGTMCYVSPTLRRCSIASRFRTTNNRYDTIVRACIESALVTWVGLLLYEICSLAPNGHVVVRLAHRRSICMR